MRRIFTLLLLSTGAFMAKAQEQSIPSFDLDQCLEYALENATRMKNSLLDEKSADSKIKETVGLGLPQLTGSASVQKSPTLQRFFSTFRPDPTTGDGFALTGEQASQIGVEEGDVFATENFFQLPANGDLRLSINQLLFNGSYFVGIQASKAFKELAVKRKDKIEGDVKSDIAKAYFNYLINKDRLRLYEANITRLDTLYRNTIALNKNGFAEKIDVDRLKISLNNARAEQSNINNLFILSERLLKFQMNYPINDPINITGSIEDVMDRAAQDISINVDYLERPDYQVLMAEKELEKFNLKNKYAETLPTINFFADLGLSTQSPNFRGLFTTQSNFGEVGPIGPDKWYKYSTIGFRLNWNIFTGLQKHHQIQQQKIEFQKLENRIEQFEAQIHAEVKDAHLTYLDALRSFQIQVENIELAESILKISQIKYEEGVGSNLELVEADNSLKQAQTHYYNALFETIISKIDLYRALGRDE